MSVREKIHLCDRLKCRFSVATVHIMNGQILTLVVTTALTSILLQFMWYVHQGEAALETIIPAIQGAIEMKMQMKREKMMMKMMQMQMTTPTPMMMYNITMPKMKKKKGKKGGGGPKLQGCYMKRRIIRVTIPKYKYVDVPYGKAVEPIDMKAVKFKKGINLGHVIEEPVSEYAHGGYR